MSGRGGPPTSRVTTAQESDRHGEASGPIGFHGYPSPVSRIAVIGAGYVGLTTAVCLAHLDHDVSCADASPDPCIAVGVVIRSRA